MSEESKSKHRFTIGRLFLLLALIGLTALVVSRFTDFRDFINTLERGNWIWITAGLVIHIVYFFAYSYLYQRGFDLVGVESRTMALLPVVFAGIFVNAVIPSGGAGAAALFIDDAVDHRQSAGRAAIGVVLVLLADLFTLLPFIAWGFVFLVIHHKLAGYDAISAGIFVGYIGALCALLYFSRKAPRGLSRVLHWIRRLVNRLGKRFHKPDLISEKWPEKTSSEFREAVTTMIEHPAKLAALAGWATIAHVINVVGLWALIHAFGIILPVSGIVAAFGMGIVFFIASPVPQGIAVVEAVMTLVFTSLGMPKQKAITVTMIFRGVNFWLPLVIGMGFIWRVRNFGQHKRKRRAEAAA